MGVRPRQSIALILALLSLGAFANEEEPTYAGRWATALQGDETGLEIKTDLSYCSARGVKLGAEWARPAKIEEGKKLPVILLLHGNGRTGKRDAATAALERYFARHGFVAVSIDYRTSGFPEPVLDIRCAVRWIKGSAENLKGDPQKVAVMGLGFGGYLATLLAASGDKEKFPKTGDLTSEAKKNGSGVRAAINAFGPMDLQNQFWREAADTFPGPKILAAFLPASPLTDAKLFLVASPAAHLSPDSSPVFTFHGTKDKQYPFEHAAFIDEQFQHAQIAHTLLPIPGAGHGLLGPKGTLQKEKLLHALSAALGWLRISLKQDPIQIAAEAKTKMEEARAPAGGEPKEPLDEWW